MNAYVSHEEITDCLIIGRLHHNLQIVPIDDFASTLLSNLRGHLVIRRDFGQS